MVSVTAVAKMVRVVVLRCRTSLMLLVRLSFTKRAGAGSKFLDAVLVGCGVSVDRHMCGPTTNSNVAMCSLSLARKMNFWWIAGGPLPSPPSPVLRGGSGVRGVGLGDGRLPQEWAPLS